MTADYNAPTAPNAPYPNQYPPPYSHSNSPGSGQYTNLSSLSSPSPSTPQYNPNPYANNNNSNNNRGANEQRFAEILSKYEISRDFSDRLQKYLFGTKIVYVYDDSGSMNSVLNDSPLNTGLFKATRWDELKNFSKVSIEIANIFNPNGVDVFFLNRPVARNVKSLADLDPYFVNRPNGYTPLRRVCDSVLAENRNVAENKLLLVIVTDGEPTDDYGREDIHGFKKVLQSRGKNVYTTIVSCTDEDHTMDYLNNWDRVLPRLDVVDDYRNERLEVLRAKGQRFPFSYGDYIVKTLIGSMDPQLDNMDEQKDCGCTIV